MNNASVFKWIKASCRPIASALALVLGGLAPLYAPSEAEAVQYTITGNFEQFCCNWPNGGQPTFIPGSGILVKINDFPFAGGGGGMTIRSGFPGTIAGVNATAGGAISFPAQAIHGTGSFLDTMPGLPGFITLFTAVNFANQQGTLAPGGQTGTRSYCANYAGNPNCTAPSKGTVAGLSFNGRLAQTPGNQFGGTMRILGGTPGFLRRTSGGPSRIRLGYFAAPLTQIGGPFSEYQPETNTAFFWPTTLPATNPASATSTAVANILFAGIPWGTGVVYAGATGGTGAVPTQSITGSGSDARTASGLGNISLVAASMAGAGGNNVFPVLVRLNLTVPEPGTTLLFASGAVLLGVLAVRWQRVRRRAITA